MAKVIVTHEEDAKRYLDCGWELIRQRDVILKGINKSFVECSVMWQGENPVFPQGDAPSLKTVEVKPNPKQR